MCVGRISLQVLLCNGAGGNHVFAARAYNKTAGILAAYPKTVESGKELKLVQGIGKGSMDKVRWWLCPVKLLIKG